MSMNLYNDIFDKVIEDYHIFNDISHPLENPYSSDSLEFLLYEKCRIDTMQWHMEDEVRNPDIDAQQGMIWKKMIDQSNQERTNTVERLDDYYYQKLKAETISENARLNTESPAWAVDRLSILALKIYHMREETKREDADQNHIALCTEKLYLLLQQREDLSSAIDDLFEDYKTGRKYMKVYRQVKMYNDPTLNPVLYEKKK